jgi:hypothetical protein
MLISSSWQFEAESTRRARSKSGPFKPYWILLRHVRRRFRIIIAGVPAHARDDAAAAKLLTFLLPKAATALPKYIGNGDTEPTLNTHPLRGCNIRSASPSPPPARRAVSICERTASSSIMAIGSLAVRYGSKTDIWADSRPTSILPRLGASILSATRH